MRKRIRSQPRVFQIGTPAGNTIDLGGEFEVRVQDDGATELRVITGQVAFEFDDREVFVPATATRLSCPGRGRSAPVFDTARAEFRAALARVEFAAEPSTDDFSALVQAAELEDSLTLWHLFEARSSAPALRSAAFDQLSKAVPNLEGVTDAGLPAGDLTRRDPRVVSFLVGGVGATCSFTGRTVLVSVARGTLDGELPVRLTLRTGTCDRLLAVALLARGARSSFGAIRAERLNDTAFASTAGDGLGFVTS